MKQYIITALLFFSIVANVFGFYVIIMQDDIIADLEWEIKATRTVFKIQSESVKRLSHRVDELKTANTALMIELDKKGYIRAINNTPLPKMIKDKK